MPQVVAPRTNKAHTCTHTAVGSGSTHTIQGSRRQLVRNTGKLQAASGKHVKRATYNIVQCFRTSCCQFKDSTTNTLVHTYATKESSEQIKNVA